MRLYFKIAKIKKCGVYGGGKSQQVRTLRKPAVKCPYDSINIKRLPELCSETLFLYNSQTLAANFDLDDAVNSGLSL